MAEHKQLYDSKESIFGFFPKSGEWVEYKSVIRIRNGGKMPVTIDMTFVPPHPFAFNMPLTHRIQGESVTDAYAKVVKFFRRFDIEFRN
jgi:hypothetical protein